MESDESRICFCPQCDTHVPSLKFVRKKRGYVNVSCVCGYEKELNIKDYLTMLKQNTKKMTFKTKCTEHNSKPFVSYCFLCKKHLCEDCKDNHNPLVIHFSSYSIEEARKEYEEKKETYVDYIKKQAHGCFSIRKRANEIEEALLNDSHLRIELYKLILDNYINNYEMFRLSTKFGFNNFFKWQDDKSKQLSKDYSIIKENFQKIDAKFESVKSFPGCEGYLRALLLLQDGRICTCNTYLVTEKYDIKIFNPANDYKCEIVINDHKKKVNSLCELSNGILVSCSDDRTIKYWKLGKDSYECVHSIPVNYAINQIIELPGDRLLTSFFDIYSTKEPYNDQPTKIKNELDTSPEQKQLMYFKEKDLIIGIAITGNNFEGGLDIINGTTLEVVKSVRGIYTGFDSGNCVPINNEKIFLLSNKEIKILDITVNELDKEDPKNEEVMKKKLEKAIVRVIKKTDIISIFELKKEELYLFGGVNDLMILYDYIRDEYLSFPANCGQIQAFVRLNEKEICTTSVGGVSIWKFKC